MLPARRPTTPANCMREISPHSSCTWSQMGGSGSNQETKSFARRCSHVVGRSSMSECESFSLCRRWLPGQHKTPRHVVLLSSDTYRSLPLDHVALLCFEGGNRNTAYPRQPFTLLLSSRAPSKFLP